MGSGSPAQRPKILGISSPKIHGAGEMERALNPEPGVYCSGTFGKLLTLSEPVQKKRHSFIRKMHLFLSHMHKIITLNPRMLEVKNYIRLLLFSPTS